MHGDCGVLSGASCVGAAQCSEVELEGNREKCRRKNGPARFCCNQSKPLGSHGNNRNTGTGKTEGAFTAARAFFLLVFRALLGMRLTGRCPLLPETQPSDMTRVLFP